MKFFVTCALLVASCLAEPPVDNRYLPPQSRSSPPSQTYGVPGFGLRQTDAVFRGRPSSTYGAPARSLPNSQYGPPQATNQHQGRSQAPINQYLPPTNQYQAVTIARSSPSQSQVPTNQYLPPSNQYLPPTSQYQAINQRLAQTQNQAPTARYLPPTSQYYQAPSTQYGLPEQTRSNTPSTQYGAPGFARSGSDGGYDNAQSRQYLPPSVRGYDDGSNGEPANYDFEYMVQDAASGNDFGHKEGRRGDRAEGRYYVLLPDGRIQTVEYEADQEGFKPRISYEETDTGAGYDGQTSGPY